MTFGVDEILVGRKVWLRFADVTVFEEVWEDLLVVQPCGRVNVVALICGLPSFYSVQKIRT